jgi:hypothetical protein
VPAFNAPQVKVCPFGVPFHKVGVDGQRFSVSVSVNENFFNVYADASLPVNNNAPPVVPVLVQSLYSPYSALPVCEVVPVFIVDDTYGYAHEFTYAADGGDVCVATRGATE